MSESTPTTVSTTLTLYTERPGRAELLALALILLVATALRLGMPGAVEFKRDEANLSRLALDMARGRDFPLLGIVSSIGVNNAPFSVYVLVPPYLFSSDPTLATQYVGLLNVLAVFLTYALARRYYGPGAALIAAACFAVGPWPVIFSRKIWAQDMLPVFVLLTVGSGLLGFLEGKRWAQVAHLPLLFITGQIHYATFVLVPISAYLIITGHRRLSRTFWISVGVAVLTVVPFILGAIRALIPIAWMIPDVVSVSSAGHTISLSDRALRFTILALGGTDLHAFAGWSRFQDYLSRLPALSYPLFDAFAMAALASGGWLLVRLLRNWRAMRAARAAGQPYTCPSIAIDTVLVLWLFLTPLLFSVTWAEMQIHYVIVIFPAAFIVLGVALTALGRGLEQHRALRRAVMGLLGSALALTLALQVWALVALHDFVYEHATPNGFGIPLGYLTTVRDGILEKAPAQVLARLDGQAVGQDDESTVWDFLLSDVPVRRFLADGIEVYPADGALLLDQSCAGDPREVQEGRVFPMRTDLESGHPETCYRIRTRAPAAFDRTGYEPVEALPLSVGARLIAYRWQPAEGCLSTAWQLDGPTAGPTNDIFLTMMHFIDEEGREVAVRDVPFWQGRYWRAGDVITREGCLGESGVPAGRVTGVRLGLYTYQDGPDGRTFYQADLIDVAGHPAGQFVELRWGRE